MLLFGYGAKVGLGNMRVKAENRMLTLIFLIVILMGCNSTPNRSILRQVESYMEEHPDSALFLLNSIAHPEKLSGREQAEYALFYTQSCEKNFILQLNDSLIKIAVDYFESQAGGLKTAQSYFYMGCIYQNRNEHANAVRAFINCLLYTSPSPRD